MIRTGFRRVALLMATLLVASLALVDVSTNAAASGGSSPVWIVPFSSTQVFPTTTPSGDVIANTYPLQELTPAGSQVWQLDPAAAQQSMGVPTVTDVAGNTYVWVGGNDGWHLESFSSSGTVRWLTPALPAQGCCNFITLGWDGNVYTSERGSYGGSKVLGFDQITGAETADLPAGFGDVTGMFAYSGGLIVVDSSSSVSYYSYAGSLQAHVDGGPAVNAYAAYSATSGGNGTIFLAGYGATTGCTVPSVEEITPSGIQWTWTSPTSTSCSQTSLAATPDGGVILEDGSGYVSLSATGSERWTYAPTSPQGTAASGVAPVVDSNGIVAIPFSYTYATVDSPRNFGTEVDFLSQGSAAPSLPSIDYEAHQCGYDDGYRLSGGSNAADIGPNQVYLGLLSACSASFPASIQAFAQRGLGTNYRLSVTTPGLDQVGYSSVVPDNVSVAGVWPSPDGSHLALFNDGGSLYTYIARMTTASVKPYPAVQVPGGFSATSFGPDSTAYIIGETNPGTAISVGQILSLRPGASDAKILHQWPTGQYPFAIEYIGDHLYVAVEINSINCALNLQEFDLDGNQVGTTSTSPQVSCGDLWRATTNELSVASHRGGVFQFFDPTTLAATTFNLGFDAAAMGRDGAWSILTGNCSSTSNLVRLDRSGATLLDQPLDSVAPSAPGRCDIPGVAVMSDLTTAVGFYDAVGVLHVYLVPSTGGVQHLADIQHSADAGAPARFATDDNGHLIIAHEQTVSCSESPCEQIIVDTYNAAGIVSSSTIGGTYGDSDYLIGPISVDDGSIAVNVTQGAYTGANNLQPDVRVVSAPVLRETWHDPAALAPPPADQLSLTATPTTQSVGNQVSLLATLRTANGVPIPDTLVTFGATSGPDAGRFAAIIRTDANGVAVATLRGVGAGTDIVQAWIDSNVNGVLDVGEPYATTSVAWQPREAVVFIQGIGSSSTCDLGSADFVGRVSWLRNAITALLSPGISYAYYGYRSPHTTSPTCSGSSDPQYTKADTCWSIDDIYGNATAVPGGGEAKRLSSYLTAYLKANPGQNISIVTHSQGGVLAAYTVKQVLPANYAKRVRAIVTLDSPLRGINSIAPLALDIAAGCPTSNQKYDSPGDMAPGSAVIRRINDSTKPAVTQLYTVDADPGRGFGVKLVDDAHSTTSCRTLTSWCASAHIQIAAKTHGDIWDGCFPDADGLVVCANSDGSGLVAPGIQLTRFIACAIDNLSADCTAYAQSRAAAAVNR